MEEIKRRIKELRDKIDEIERECCFVQDYKLIIALLDKLEVNEIELTNDEVSNNNSIYLLKREDGRIIITKQQND